MTRTVDYFEKMREKVLDIVRSNYQQYLKGQESLNKTIFKSILERKSQLHDPFLFKYPAKSNYHFDELPYYEFNDVENLLEDFNTDLYDYEESIEEISDEVVSTEVIPDQVILAQKMREVDLSFEFLKPFEKVPDKKIPVNISSWFPLFCNGVSRIIGITPNKTVGSRLMATGAILTYNERENVIETLDGRFNLIGKLDVKKMEKHLSPHSEISLNAHFRLSEQDWLKNIVKFCLKVGSKFNLDGNLPMNKMSKKEFEQCQISQLKITVINKLLKDTTKVEKSVHFETVSTELESILKLCQSNGSWYNELGKFLKNCGQNLDLIKSAKEFGLPSNVPVKLKDLDYMAFYHGNKVNSSFIETSVDLVLWSIKKDDDSKYFIRGLKWIKDGNKLSEIEPLLISSVTGDRHSVMANGCKFKLVGPMYKFAIIGSYPETKNAAYLDAFQYYFSNQIPDCWRELISVMHIICQCTELNYAPNETSTFAFDDSFNLRSPSFLPTSSRFSVENSTLLSQRSMKDPVTIIDLNKTPHKMDAKTISKPKKKTINNLPNPDFQNISNVTDPMENDVHTTSFTAIPCTVPMLEVDKPYSGKTKRTREKLSMVENNDLNRVVEKTKPQISKNKDTKSRLIQKAFKENVNTDDCQAGVSETNSQKAYSKKPTKRKISPETLEIGKEYSKPNKNTMLEKRPKKSSVQKKLAAVPAAHVQCHDPSAKQSVPQSPYGCPNFGNIRKTKSGRWSLPTQDPRTGLSLVIIDDSISVLKDYKFLMDLPVTSTRK